MGLANLYRRITLNRHPGTAKVHIIMNLTALLKFQGNLVFIHEKKLRFGVIWLVVIGCFQVDQGQN